MTKKIIALLMLILMLGMVACDKDSKQEAVPTAAPEQTAPVAEATPVPTVKPTEEPVPGTEESVFEQTTQEKEEEKKPETENGSANEQPVATPEPQQPVLPDNTLTEYERYQQLSPSEQKAHMDSFASIDAFFEWYNGVKDAHEAQNPSISVGDGVIDMNEITGTNK